MTSSRPLPRLAVLIDGENVSHRLASRLFGLIEPLGAPAERIVFGDFSGSASGWSAATVRFAIEARQVFPAASRKNSADIALAIEAVDLCWRDEAEAFCIVSSDGDFAGLASRLRRSGREVYGVGSSKTTTLCRSAYTRFLLLDAEAKSRPASVPAPPHPALRDIRSVLDGMASEDGWYSLSTFGTAAGNAKVNLKRFGKKLCDLLLATGQYEFKPGSKHQWFRQTRPSLAPAPGKAALSA